MCTPTRLSAIILFIFSFAPFIFISLQIYFTTTNFQIAIPFAHFPIFPVNFISKINKAKVVKQFANNYLFLVYMAINRHYVTNFIHIFVEIITVDNVDKSVDSLYMGIICSHFVHISSTLLYYGNFIFVSFCIMCPEQYFGKNKKYENFFKITQIFILLYSI